MRAAVLLLWAGAATAGPLFEDAGSALPGPHVYSGGWEHFVGGGVAVFDCNGDARPEIVAAGGEAPAVLWINRSAAEGLRFEDGGLEPVTGVTGAYALDIDSDGHRDLVLLRVGANLVLRGDGACGFSPANDLWGIDGGDSWTTAFTALWEAGQDWPTLVFGNYVDRADPEGPFGACDDHALIRPGSDGYAAAVPLAPGYCALSMLASDWLRSGTPELRISNDRHYYLRGGYEQMWRLDPLQERGEGDGWRQVSLWGMGIASRDLTGNGYPDVMLTSMGDQLLQFNEAGALRDAPYGQGSQATRPHTGTDGRPSTGWHAEFADVDNDGHADLFIAKGNVDQMPGLAMKDPNNLLMQQADGTFVEAADSAGVASEARGRGAALADLDGDGRLDLVVVNRRAPLELWRNVTGDAGHWLAVSPRQAGANRDAVGAWVEVETAQGVQRQERTVGGGHAGGTLGPLHFGLGIADRARVRVIWPDGTATDWREVAADQALTLDR